LVVLNLTPVVRTGYRIGVPFGGDWTEILNSDAEVYGGSGAGNYGQVTADPEPFHGRPFSLCLTLPALSTLVFEAEQPASKPQPEPGTASAADRSPSP
jgi:1,4-alpha-glucan branching enzyme